MCFRPTVCQNLLAEQRFYMESICLLSTARFMGLLGKMEQEKTTLLRLISGLMKPTKGTVNLQTGKPFIGYMPQSCRFDDNTTVSETIRFCSIAKRRYQRKCFLWEKTEIGYEQKGQTPVTRATEKTANDYSDDR